MKQKTLTVAALLILLSTPASVLAETPRLVFIRVVDERGKPVEDAEVRARYLETVRQDGKVYRVPQELGPSQKTDVNGRCRLRLRDVSWSLAGLKAHRVELTTEEAIELYDDAPKDRLARKAFEREIDDRCQRYSSAYQILTPDHDPSQPITLKMAKAVKVTGRVHVGGKPLAKGFVMIYSPKTEIDRLFPRSSPWLTDRQGQFSFYTVPGKLDRAQIVVERQGGKRVLNLTDVPSQPTPAGLVFNFDTEAGDYKLVRD